MIRLVQPAIKNGTDLAYRGQTGFTLVEVLIALFIFALIAASTVYTLRLGLTAKDQLTRSDEGLRQMQGMRLLIKDDLAQLLPRSVRDEFGNKVSNGFQGGATANTRNFEDETEILLHFVRNGWTNPDFNDPRASIQRVEYILRGDRLIRRIYPFPDEARDQASTERVMLAGLVDVEVEFLTGFDRGEAQWIDRWPVNEILSTPIFEGEGEAGLETPSPPLAINMRFAHPRYGVLSQLFWIGRLGEGTS